MVDLFESLFSNSSDETDDIIISENIEDNSEKNINKNNLSFEQIIKSGIDKIKSF